MKIQTQNPDTKYYRTKDFYLAAFLFAKSSEINNISKLDGKHSEFVFILSPELEQLIHSYYSPLLNDLCLVDARIHVQSIKNIKNWVHNGF